MELDILSLLGRGISYSSIERVRRRSSILCGLMFGTGPMVPDSSFEPVLEPEKVRCRSIPGKVSEVKNPSPWFESAREERSCQLTCVQIWQRGMEEGGGKSDS